MSDDLLKMLDDGIMPQSCDDCAIDSAIYVACGRGSCLAETRLHHKIAEHIRAQAARIAELEGQSGLDRIAAHNRIAELEAAILGLLEWAQQPDVRATNMSAWIHGVRVSEERSRALGAYWDRAREALRAAEKEEG